MFRIWLMLNVFFLFGCKSGSDGTFVKTEKFSSGKMKSEITMKSDSVKDGFAKYYHKNGKLLNEVTYKNNLINGWVTQYDSMGYLQSKVHYFDGIKDGKAIWYYSTGKIKSEAVYKGDKQFCSGFFYRPNGTISSYQCIDFTGAAFYVVKYDELGGIVSKDGIVLSPNILINGNSEVDSIEVNKEVTIEIALSRPPKCETKILVKEVSTNNEVMASYELNAEDECIVSFKKKINIVGKYRFVIRGILMNEMGAIVDETDNLLELFVVDGK
jgi:antitoxin component YwqK of YwqJK toxin-antitoxin module